MMRMIFFMGASGLPVAPKLFYANDSLPVPTDYRFHKSSGLLTLRHLSPSQRHQCSLRKLEKFEDRETDDPFCVVIALVYGTQTQPISSQNLAIFRPKIHQSWL